jgi:hypothetical protein
LNEVHSDNDLDEEDDNKDDVDPNDRAGNDDDNNVDDIDFYLDDLDSDNHDSEDDDDNGSDGNLGVFDFDEADVPHHNDGMHDDHEGSIGGPPFETLHIGQGFCFDHNVAVSPNWCPHVVINTLKPFLVRL